MAEFALVAPIFVLLLFAIIEGGRFIFHYEALNNAAREGVRYAIVHGEKSPAPTGPGSGDPTGSAIRQAVSDSAFSLVAAGDLTFPTPTCTGGNPAPGLCYIGPNGSDFKRGNTVHLTVSYTYPPIIPILPPITISAEASGVINN